MCRGPQRLLLPLDRLARDFINLQQTKQKFLFPTQHLSELGFSHSQRFRFPLSVLRDVIASPLSTLPGLVPNPAHDIGALPRPPLNAKRHPRYWSRSEISDGSRRSIRGKHAAAPRPTRRFYRTEIVARRTPLPLQAPRKSTRESPLVRPARRMQIQPQPAAAQRSASKEDCVEWESTLTCLEITE